MIPGKILMRHTALAAAVSAALASGALASLTIDVQTAGGGKSAVVSAAGEQVQLEIFAIVTGSNGTGADDGLQIAQGSFLSTGGLQGSLAATVAAPFNGVGSSLGAVTDLDSDGDADVGSNNNAAGTGFWITRSESPQSPNGYPSESPPIAASSFGSVAGSSYRVQLGTLIFTASSNLAESTAVNFRVRNSSSAAHWFEEVFSPSKTPANGTFASGAAPVTITLAPQWDEDADGTWSTPGNWSAAIPDGVGVGARFLGAISQNRVITLDSPRTLGSITFSNTASQYTIAGTDSITMDVASGQSSIVVLAGDHTIAAPMTFADDAVIDVRQPTSALTFSGDISSQGQDLIKLGPGDVEVKNVRAQTLTISGGAVHVTPSGAAAGVSVVESLSLGANTQLDLADNDLVVNQGSFTTIQALVLNGFGNHTGIASSTSDGSQILALFDNAQVGAGDWQGLPIGANAVVGKYTYFGDVNIDGQVTGDDYTVIDANLNTTPVQGLGWLSGDANLDGIVTGDDYTVIDANLGLGAGNPLDMSHNGVSPVPEPGAAMVLVLLATPLMSRYRAQKRGF